MPPEVQLRDENNVDLMSGGISFDIPSLTIGSGEFTLARIIDYVDKPSLLTSLPSDNLRAGLFISGPSNVGTLGKDSQKIIVPVGGGYATYSGGRVVYNGDGTASYTLRDGTAISIDVTGSSNGMTGPATRVVWPDGKVRRYYYDVSGTAGAKSYVLKSIVQNNGLQIHYNTNSVVAINLATEFCDPAVVSCSLQQAWPTSTWTYGPYGAGTGGSDIFTNAAGETTTMVRNADDDLIEARLPLTGGQTTVSYDRCNTSRLGPYKCYWSKSDGIGGTQIYPLFDKTISETSGGATWNFNYTWNISNWYAQYQRSGLNGNRTLFFYTAYNQSWPVWLDDDFGRYNFSNNESSRVTSHVWKAGNEEDFTYDDRGNVLQIVYKAVPGSGLPDQTLTANYDATCANYKTCNKPNWVVDRNGNRTDFQYSPTHGQITREIGPAVNGVQPVTRYYYTQKYAWYLGANGSYVRDPDGVWLLTSKKICKSGATVADACAISGDEITYLYEYGPDSGPNNLWLRGEGVQADGQTLWTCYTYDRFGNRVSATAPNANLTACP